MSVAAIAILATASLLGGCTPKREAGTVNPPERVLERVDFSDLPGWNRDRQAQAIKAFKLSCKQLGKLPADKPLAKDSELGGTGSVADWRVACNGLAGLDRDDDDAARRFLESQFVPFRVRNGDASKGLFTGYYEAEIRASDRRHGAYKVPIYARPPTLVTRKLGSVSPKLTGQRVRGRIKGGRLVPFYSRAEIEAGKVTNGWQVILWADDPVDLFIAHIQGSALVRLPDGSRRRIGYAADNGKSFVAIGRLMLDRKIIGPEQASMQAIRAWLKANAKQGRALMQENPRYIFFRTIEGAGPIGAHGVPLTAGRSLAVDPKYIPLGGPVWLDTSWPGNPKRPLRRLMIAQDRGNAIKGAVRGDVYWGSGEQALAQAGKMKQSGTYYLLLPRAVADRVAPRPAARPG